MDKFGTIYYAALVEQLDILVNALGFSWPNAIVEVVTVNRLNKEQEDLMMRSWNTHHGLYNI